MCSNTFSNDVTKFVVFDIFDILLSILELMGQDGPDDGPDIQRELGRMKVAGCTGEISIIFAHRLQERDVSPYDAPQWVNDLGELLVAIVAAIGVVVAVVVMVVLFVVVVVSNSAVTVQRHNYVG